MSPSIMRAFIILALVALVAAGCATVPGQNYPKQASTALAHPETTKLGRQLEAKAREHPSVSGFRLLPQGVDGFLVRAEMPGLLRRRSASRNLGSRTKI